jgi:hypothetical protein
MKLTRFACRDVVLENASVVISQPRHEKSNSGFVTSSSSVIPHSSLAEGFHHWALNVERWTFRVEAVKRGFLPFSLFAVCSWLFAIVFFVIASTASAQVGKTPAQVHETPAQIDEAPYFGDWENDRGDTLQITNDTIKVNEEKPARYDDITEDSDESFFVLQIKDSSEVGYFGGNFLRFTFGKDPDHFSMSVYKTLPDTLKKENEVKHIEWSAPAVEEEETEETPPPKEEQPAGEQKKDEEKKSDQPEADQSAEKPTPSPSATSSPNAP